ncbi:MAG: IS5/IS1182 family transposase, partial [Clostridia bacterium]
MRNKYYIEGENPGQCSLIPLNIDDMISQDNAIRFIGAFIDSLDLQKLGFLRSTAAVTGRPG